MIWYSCHSFVLILLRSFPDTLDVTTFLGTSIIDSLVVDSCPFVEPSHTQRT
jgi:hypothetical protein